MAVLCTVIAASKKTSKKSSKKNAKKKGGKRPGLQRQCTQLASALIEQMQRLRDTFFVVQLVDDPAKAMSNVIKEKDELVKCDLMEGRWAFLQLARDNHYQVWPCIG
jgi:transcription initiation factor IIF auxiliary subunit